MKAIARLIAPLLISLLLWSPFAQAGTTLLPKIDEGDDFENCTDTESIDFQIMVRIANGGQELLEEEIDTNGVDYIEPFLACTLKMGYVKLWMVPYFILFAVQFLVGLTGLLAVLMIVLGAYFYIAGSLSDEKEKGKNIITYALGGLVVSTVSWIGINLILLVLTS